MTASEVEDMLNKQSGVQGISGLAPDFRVIESESYTDNERAKIAMESNWIWLIRVQINIWNKILQIIY